MRFGIGSGSDGGGGGIGGGGIGGGRSNSWDDPLLTDSSIIMFLDVADISKSVSIRRSVSLSVHLFISHTFIKTFENGMWAQLL